MAKAKPITNIDSHAPTGKNARIIANTRLEEMYSWDAYVDDPSNVKELHNLRIAAKRLRYTLEIFEETFPQECKPIIQEVTQIQEELGAIHDKDVMMALLQLSLNGYSSDIDAAGKDDMVEQHEQEKMVDPGMLAFLLDARNPPSTIEREGLQLLWHDLQRQREERYSAFRQHWYQLKKQEFQHEITILLDS